MRVSAEAARNFSSLYTLLLYYAGQVRKLLPAEMSLDEFREGPQGLKIRCRDAIYEPTLLIGRFLEDNIDLLSADARATLAKWEGSYVKGTFAVMRHLKKHSIFISTEGVPRGYGVVGLNQELKDMIPKEIVPALVKTVLLPYEGVIVTDDLILAAGHVKLDRELKREMTEQYKMIEQAGELITRLD
jgi:hypothetical protein